MSKWNVRQIAFAAAVAALYAVMTYFADVFGLGFGAVQVRFSEALCVLPFLFPGAVPGLFIGCLIANILSPYGMIDVICGSAATLIAAVWTSKVKHRWLAPLPPVLCNGLIIGAMLAWYEAQGFGPQFPPLFAFNGITVALGEIAACYVLGLLLLAALEKIPHLRELERSTL